MVKKNSPDPIGAIQNRQKTDNSMRHEPCAKIKPS